MWKHFLSLIFPDPNMCVCCETPLATLGLCEKCRNYFDEVARLEGQCGRCGVYGVRAPVCDTCREWPAYYKGNTALLPYTGKAREAIVRFKFHNEPWRVRGFADVIKRHAPIEADALVPVPLHPKRLRERGYNQSLLLARVIAEAWALPVATDWLVRTVNTPHQTGLAKSARKDNVAHAFAVPPKTVETVKGKDILLVDDVITTGSTLLACARTLHQAGAGEIYSMTLAAGIR